MNKIHELINNLSNYEYDKLLNYLKVYFSQNKFDTEIILWNEKFESIKDFYFLNDITCIENLFPDLRLKLINQETIKQQKSLVKLDYSIGFDVNTASYIVENNIKEKCFNKNFTKIELQNYDFMPYLIENYIKFEEDFFTNKNIYQNIFEIYRKIFPQLNSNEIEIMIKELYYLLRNNISNFKIFKDFHLSLQIFIMGLIYANLNFSKKEEKIKYILKIMHNEIGMFLQREFIYAIKFFEGNKSISGFFNQKTQLNINEFDLINNIENMAFDLLLIRNMEYFFSLKQTRENDKADLFIPFIFSSDKLLLKLLNEVKIKALVVTKNKDIQKITPVYFDDITKLLHKYKLEIFFEVEKIKEREKIGKNIDLANKYENIKKILLEKFLQKKEENLIKKSKKKNQLQSDKLKKCIYCDNYKDEHKFSLEHIFPSALGGKYLDGNLFKTHNVCKECNNRFGLYVDGIFLKSFFIKNEIFNHYLDYYIDDDKYTIPFTFIGTLEMPKIKHPNYKYCDYWIWSGGSKVYHFHNNYNEFFKSYVSGHPIKFKNKKEAGEVYLVGVKQNINIDLFKTMLFSFKEQFKYQKRFSANIELNIIDKRIKKYNEIKFFDEPDDIQKIVIKKILEIANKEHKLNIMIQIGNEWRFLSKLAIGIGYNLFGIDYLQTNEYKTFLKIINEPDINNIEKILIENPLMGNYFSSMTEQLKQIGNFLAFKSGHTLVFQVINNDLYFVMYLYNKKYPYVVKLANNINQYRKNKLIEIYKEGFVYVCIPAMKISIGPIDIGAYIAYLQGNNNFLQENHKNLFAEIKRRFRNEKSI